MDCSGFRFDGELFHRTGVEQVALAWLEGVRWSVKDGAEIAPGERDDYAQVLLAQRLRDALAQINLDAPRRGAGGCLPQADAVSSRDRGRRGR